MQRLSAISAWFGQRPKTSIAIAVMVVLLGLYVGPLLIMHPSQDACSFGAVSNERYRQLLAEAKRRQATVWPAFVWNYANKAEENLNKRVDDLAGGAASVYERLAVMHAVVRALGGDYRRTQYDRDNPFDGKAGSASYEYYVDANGLGFFSPILRQIWVQGHLVYSEADRFNTVDPRKQQPGNVYFVLVFPTILDTHINVPRSKFGESCPRLPDPALAERLSQSH